MSPYVFTDCPSCGNSMRFNRPSTERFVVICPNCQHLFDAGKSLIEQGLVPATLIRRGDVTQERAIGPEDKSLNDPLVLEDLIPSQPIEPVRPIADRPSPGIHRLRDLRSSPVALTDPPSRPPLSQVGKNQSKTGWRTPVVAVGLLLVVLCVGGFALIRNSNLRASLGIGRYRELVLADQFAAAIKICQLQINNPKVAQDSSPALFQDSLAELEQLLADCVELQTIPEPRHRDLRIRLQDLFSSQLEFKEQAYRVVPNLSGAERLQVARLSTLISLIDLRLNYGLREVPLGSSELEAYCREGILRMRQLDHHFLISLREGLEPQLSEIAGNLDELDRLAVARSSSGELREPMPYEYRMLASASEAWHQWCLGLSQGTAATQAIARAVRDERADSWDRFQSALTQPNIPAVGIAALDRIQQQSQRAGSDLQISSLMASNTTQLKDAAEAQLSARTKQPQEAGPIGAPSVAARLGLGSTKLLNGGDSEEGLGQIADSTRSTRPSSSIGQHNGKSDSSPSLDYAATPDSLRDTGRATQPQAILEQPPGAPGFGTSDQESMAALEFPAPKYSGPNSLCIKVQAISPNRVKEQAEALGRRLKITPDVQESGNLITISFGSFSGNPFEVADNLELGVVEIVDGQSRTLFVVQ